MLIVLSSEDVDEGKIQMNKGMQASTCVCTEKLRLVSVARNNLRVKLGDVANVHACHDIKYVRIHASEIDQS